MSTMLIGAPSQMDDLFLPASFTPAFLARELREDMQHDTLTLPVIPLDTLSTHLHESERRGNEKRTTPPPTPSSTQILVDALVTDPTPTTRWYQASLVSVFVTLLVLAGVALGRGYVRLVLLWLQGEGLGMGVAIFTLLFFLVSFPVCWGYGLLLVAAGYLYGCVQGPLLSLVCTAFGLTLANSLMRTCCRAYMIGRLYSGKVQAILQVLNSPQGLKIVALTRLTPIPFGLQNALFSFSDMRQVGYLLSSLLGLSPMTALYCYIGSTLRSMEDVLSNSSSQLTAYLILGGQLVLTGVLAFFVVRKARGELRKAMEQSTADSSLTALQSCVVTD